MPLVNIFQPRQEWRRRRNLGVLILVLLFLPLVVRVPVPVPARKILLKIPPVGRRRRLSGLPRRVIPLTPVMRRVLLFVLVFVVLRLVFLIKPLLLRLIFVLLIMKLLIGVMVILLCGPGHLRGRSIRLT